MNLGRILRVRWTILVYAHSTMPTAAVSLICPAYGNVVSLDLPSQTYCCMLGHAFSSEQQATATQQTLTHTLWSCLRQLEERQ
jgi:hypothetical protein